MNEIRREIQAQGVVNLRGKSVCEGDFELSVQGQFLAEARTAVAMSRRGRVHLVDEVSEETLRALHAETRGGEWAGSFPLAVRCQDGESLCGPMMRGIRKEGQEWLMGDGVVVRFFEEMPGPEEGDVVPPVCIVLSEEGQRNLEAFEKALAKAEAEARGS